MIPIKERFILYEIGELLGFKGGHEKNKALKGGQENNSGCKGWPSKNSIKFCSEGIYNNANTGA